MRFIVQELFVCRGYDFIKNKGLAKGGSLDNVVVKMIKFLMKMV